VGERLAADIGALLAGVLLAGLFVFVVLMARRWLLERGGGTVECGLRTVAGAGGAHDRGDTGQESGGRAAATGRVSAAGEVSAAHQGPGGGGGGERADDGRPGAWRLGIARYSRDSLCWYRLFSFRFKPAIVMRRRSLVVVDRREPTADELATLTPDVTVVTLRDGQNEVEVALSSPALVGFLAWLEAAPPGFPVNHLQ
jgi:hypothetical protein